MKVSLPAGSAAFLLMPLRQGHLAAIW